MRQGDRWLHAGKLFASAMLAFWISVRIGLPQTYWAIVTCCVVANPNSSAAASKAVYRIAGTCCAGILALLVASMFGSVPLLIIVVTGPLTAFGFVAATLDRTTRSYGFMLFSITLLLILIGGINSPQGLFDIAWARSCEITLGVLCVAFVDSIVAPRSIANQIRARLRRWLPDMRRWFDAVLAAEPGDQKAEDQLRIIADVGGLSLLSGQLRYDSGVPTRDRRVFFAIQRRMLRLVPLLSAIGARIDAFSPDQRQSLRPLFAATTKGRRTGDTELAVGAPLAGDVATDAWHDMLHRSLNDLLAEALSTWDEIRRLDDALERGDALDPQLATQVDAARALPLYPDWNTALRIGTGVLLAYLLIACFWQATGWAQGANALILGLVALGFFGGVDQADRAIAGFGRFAALSGCVGALLSYVLLPLVHDFPTFALAMASVMLPLAAWGASNPMATLLLALGLSSINLQGTFAPLDFGSFVESNVATLCGVFVAFFCVGTVRHMGGWHVIERLRRAQRRDIVALSRRATFADRDAYLDRSLDRIALAAGRLAPDTARAESGAWLAQLRTGANVIDMRLALATIEGAVHRAGEALLEIVRSDIAANTVTPRLMTAIDQTLRSALEATDQAPMTKLIDSLVGLRLAAFPGGARWEPVP
uniref:FUSC family protein n=1 Tax=uncultured Sphingomonas sp. TaxID=158754 RepID=UPI0035CC0E82